MNSPTKHSSRAGLQAAGVGASAAIAIDTTSLPPQDSKAPAAGRLSGDRVAECPFGGGRAADRPFGGGRAADRPFGGGRAADRLFGGGRAAACTGAVALISLVAFEAMAVSTAMPAVAQALDGVGVYALAFGGPLAASVLGMVLAGQSCDRHGAARATACGLLLFAAGLLLAGLADRIAGGMAQLVAGRVIQGLGGGMVSVALYVGMGQVVPPALHPRLFSLFATAWVLPGLVGPALAAWLVVHLGWRAVFLLAAAAVPLAAALLLPPLWRQRRAAPAGAAAAPGGSRVAWAACAALGALWMNASGQGGSGHGDWLAGWTGVRLPGWACAGLPLLGLAAAGVAAQRLLPRGSLRVRPGLPAVIALRALLAAAFGTAEAFVPLALVRTQQWTLTQAGLALSAGAICWSAGSWVQTRLQSPRRRRQGLAGGLALVGAGISALAVALQAGLPAAPAAVLALAAWSLAGFGIGLAFPMLSVLTLGLSAPAEQGRNASALQLGDALASSAALALAGLLFTAAGGANGGPGFVAVLALAAALAFTGAGVAGRAFGGTAQAA